MDEPRHGLLRYVIAAALARMADGGAIVAIVLLVNAHGGDGATAGLLGACLTAPHMLGPFVARRIDLADDGRKVIAFACVLYAIALSVGVLAYGRMPLPAVAVLFVVAGCCGPLLTGGISTRLAAIAGPDQRRRRRAQGWDVATYGIGGTVGPSLVAAVATWRSAMEAALWLAGSVFLSAWLVMRLPYSAPEHGGDLARVPSAMGTIRLMCGEGRLRRTLYMTVIVAFGMAALPIVAVQMALAAHVAPASAALMTAAYGVGNLSGSAMVMIRPLAGSPDISMPRLALCIFAGLLAIVVVDGFAITTAAYFAVGCINAFFFAATLAARTEYAPPGSRGQVFLWVAALKITAGSAGTAAAGASIGVDARMPILAAIVPSSLAALGARTERVLSPAQ